MFGKFLVLFGFVLTFCLLKGNSVLAQSKETLFQILKSDTATAKTKVDTYNALNNFYLEIGESDSAIYFSQRALRLAKKTHYPEGIGNSYTNLGHTYSRIGKSKYALSYYKAALREKQKGKFKLETAEAYINLGTAYDEISEYGNALNCYFKALDLSKKYHFDTLNGDCYQNIGIIYYNFGDLNKSLEFHLKAITCFERIKNWIGVQDAYNCLGNIYSDQRKYKIAEKAYNQSLGLSKRTKDKEGTGIVLINLGILSTDFGQYNTALKRYNEAETYLLEINDQSNLAILYNARGETYEKMGDYSKAIEMCRKGLEIARAIPEPAEIISNYLIISRVKIKQKELVESRKMLEEILSIGYKIKYKLGLREANFSLYKIDSLEGKPNEALYHFKKYITYRDSILSEESLTKSSQIAMYYAFEKKAALIQEKNKENVLHLNERNSNNKLKLIFLICLIIIISALATIIYLVNNKALKNKRQLTEVLTNENEQKEILLQEVHHRVNNSLQMMSSLLSIQAETISNPEVKSYLLTSENRIQAMSVMHKLLHQGSSNIEVDISLYIDEIMFFYRTLLNDKSGIQINVDVPSVLFHTQLAMPLGLIVNELVTNSIKYAFPTNTGIISLKLIKQDQPDSWQLIVSDDGVGYDITKPFRTESVGINIVHLMSRQINGMLETSIVHGVETKLTFSSTI